MPTQHPYTKWQMDLFTILPFLPVITNNYDTQVIWKWGTWSNRGNDESNMKIPIMPHVCLVMKENMLYWWEIMQFLLVLMTNTE